MLLGRLRLIRDEPVAVEEAYLPCSLYPGIESVNFNERSLYSTISERYGLTPVWADASIESAGAGPVESSLLGVELDMPLLIAWRITLTETDQVLEYVKSVYSGRKFLFNVGRHRIS